MRKMTLVAALSVLMALCASQAASAGAVMCFPVGNTAVPAAPRTVYNNSVLNSTQLGQSANNPYSLNSQGCAFINDADLQWAQAQGALPQTVSGTTTVYLPGPSVPYPVPVPGVPASPTDSVWQHLWVGGGGLVTGLSIPPGTGVRFARTDAGGAYVYAGGMWKQLLTTAIMPAADVVPTNSYGPTVDEIAGCNNDATCAYMLYGGYVFQSSTISTLSTNGTTFCRTGGLAQQTADEGNSSNLLALRTQGPTLAVDPNNKDHVILGTSVNGLFETFNGTACASVVWNPISTASIPLSGIFPSGSRPGYRIAFDPTSTATCHAGGGTCSAKAYIFTLNATTPGVYATTDAGVTWALTASGPVTVGRMIVSYATLGGGNLWVTEGGASSHTWRYAAGTWLRTSVNTGITSLAIDPTNGDHMVGNAGTLFQYTSTNASQATPTFNNYAPTFSGGDAPWLAKVTAVGASGGSDVGFVGSTLTYLISQGVWTTTFPTSNPTMTSNVFGIEELTETGGLQVSALGAVTVGVQDEGTCRVSVPYSLVNGATDCGVIADSLSLYYAAGLSQLPDRSLMFGKIGQNGGGGFDASGTSTDGFLSDYTPFNSWIAKAVPLTSITNNGSNLIRVTVPSTTGLTTWSAGVGSIVCAISQEQTFNTPFSTRCFTVTVVDGVTIDLQNTVFGSGIGHVPVTFFVPATALTDWVRLGDIINVVSDAGSVKITVLSSIIFNSFPICISGVTMATTTVVNGCWVAKTQNFSSFDLASSTFVGGDSYVGGGVVKTWATPGGSIAASTATNWAMYGSNHAAPYCTDNNGASWSEVTPPAGVLAVTTVTGGPYAAGSTSFTVADGTKIFAGVQIFVPLTSGRSFPMSNSGTNGYTKSGNTLTLFGTGVVPPGDSIATGASISVTPNYPAAYYIYATDLAADQVTPNTFYWANDDFGLLKWTHCGATTLVTNTGPSAGFMVSKNSLIATTLRAVPGEAGHLFFASGPLPNIGSPTSSSLFRTCNGVNNTTNSVTWNRVPGFFGAHTVGFGKAAPNATYPAVYVAGYYDPTGADLKANAVYGVWRMIYDLNHGSTGTCDVTAAWQAIGGTGVAFTGGWPVVNIHDVSGDPILYGPVYIQAQNGIWFSYAP